VDICATTPVINWLRRPTFDGGSTRVDIPGYWNSVIKKFYRTTIRPLGKTVDPINKIYRTMFPELNPTKDSGHMPLLVLRRVSGDNGKFAHPKILSL
jgi:hypothetical protein